MGITVVEMETYDPRFLIGVELEAAEYVIGKRRSFFSGLRVERLCPARSLVMRAESGELAHVVVPRWA